MKIWEKVNNITGNDSKSRYLVPYINAGSKFLLSSLPEKFLWTIASESEITGWDSGGDNQIGAGSSIAYDKVLAVYRYDGDKRRVCAEAPDKNIHIFDEDSSLLKATEMFPKFYKLSGKIYIKPDPDYNDGSSTEYYGKLGATSVITKGNITADSLTLSVASATGIVVGMIVTGPGIPSDTVVSSISGTNITLSNEGTITYSGDNKPDFTFTAVTTVFTKTGDKGIIVYSAPPIVDENSDSWILAEYENIVLFYAASLDHFRLAAVYRDLCKAQVDVVAAGTLSFTISSSLPTSMSLSKSLPTFSFTDALPGDITISSTLPSDFSLSLSLPTMDVVSSQLPSSFASPTLPSKPEELVHALDKTSIDDALTKAEQLIDGSVTTNNAQEWLNDEDAEMVSSIVNVVNAELQRAGVSINEEKSKLDEFSAKLNQRLTTYQNDISKYGAEVQKESSRISSELAKYQRDVEKSIQTYQADIGKYQQEVAKESARVGADTSKYQNELAKEKNRIDTSLAKWQASLSKVVQNHQLDVQAYQAEVQKEGQRVSSEISKYEADIMRATEEMKKDIQQFNLDIQAAQIYTQKSQQSVQTGSMFYQRAINELSAITGAVAAPEQQQTSQRAEQGAST